MSSAEIVRAYASLCSARLTGRDASRILGVSYHSLRRTVGSFRRFAEVTESDLDRLVAAILRETGQAGTETVRARLLSRGMLVQRCRVRSAVQRVDTNGAARRRHRRLQRRVYYVPYANFLWHVDGWLKLVRWKVVVHGGIDGYSRTCLFLTASTSNRGVCAFRAFMRGVELYGLPRFARFDAGGENTPARHFMVDMRGPTSALVGRSVHNQRIERFWRDVFEQVGALFYASFYRIERSGLTDVDVEADLNTLHEYFLPIINGSLEQFRRTWNEHALRTERFRSPRQLMLLSRLRSASSVGLADVESQRARASWILQSDQLRAVEPPYALVHGALDVRALLEGFTAFRLRSQHAQT